MRRIAVVCLFSALSLPVVAQEPAKPRHPLSEGVTIDEIVPPKPTSGATPRIDPVAPEEPVERRSRQPTQPPRVKPNPRPEPPAPIEMKNPLSRPEKPKAPIGTIDPRPGTIRTHPGTIEAK